MTEEPELFDRITHVTIASARRKVGAYYSLSHDEQNRKQIEGFKML